MKAGSVLVVLFMVAVFSVIVLLGLGVYKLFESPSQDPVYDTYPPTGPPAPLRVVDPQAPKPNIIIINCDDLGYGDLGSYGNPLIKTPNIDSLADQGVRFTNFYASNSVCTPSRAGLLTGRYSQRSGMTWILFAEDEPLKHRATKNAGQMLGELGLVDLGPNAGSTVLPQSEMTLAEALKAAGYRTGMVGKWHLGDFTRNPDHNPVNHGFDFYYGVPHSNDMIPFPLYRNEQQLEENIEEQAKLTGLYTREAQAFIEENAKTPFFLYLAHTFPHQPLFASERFRGKSKAGIYGDVVEEIDWSVGQILDCLKQNGLEGKTLIFFTSDNGPWYEGDPGHQRGRKGQSYEGGFRVPMIARYPGVIPAGGVCDEPAMNIDFFPTSLALAGLEPPGDRIIDGRDIMGLLKGEMETSPHDVFYYYHMDELEAVRVGDKKYIRNIHHYVWPAPVDKETKPIGKMGHGRLGQWPLLYDLALDPSESYNLIDNNPDLGHELLQKMEAWEQAQEKNPRGWIEK